MTTSTTEIRSARATDVLVAEDCLTADLAGGHGISVPLQWYPRQSYANAQERGHWELIGEGVGIHWPDLVEDISIEGLLAGRRSGESQRSLKRWLDAKRDGLPLTLDALQKRERRGLGD